MSPNVSSLVSALDLARQQLAITTAANETAAQQAAATATYHQICYATVLKARQAVKDARAAVDAALDQEYAIPDDGPANPPADALAPTAATPPVAQEPDTSAPVVADAATDVVPPVAVDAPPPNEPGSGQ